MDGLIWSRKELSLTGMTAGLILGLVVFFIAIIIINSRTDVKKARERIRKSWGKPPDESYRPEDFESISSYFRGLEKKRDSKFLIDDITWCDLDMDDIFALLNRTETTPGEATLYRLLREPAFDLDILEKRRRLIELFQKSRDDREKIQFILTGLGKNRQLDLTESFLHPVPTNPWRLRIYRLLVTIAVLSPLVLFIHEGLGALLIMVACAVNMFVYYSRRFKIVGELTMLRYVVRLVGNTGQLLEAGLTAVELAEFKTELRQVYEKIKGIGRRLLFPDSGSGSISDQVVEWLRIVLLKDLIDYEYLRNAAFEHRRELIEAYDAVGLLDSLLAVASFRDSVAFYCSPDCRSTAARDGSCLEFEDIYHPLLRNPILNSLTTDRSVLITGSNASGKSIFLKTVAVNAILAQSFCTALARKYSSPLFAVLTSMALRDSIRDGESYFIAEIKSLKRILDYLNEETPCLCLIDEVLRGTNTIERIAASSQALRHLAARNCLCMAATHDLELTFMLEGTYRNVHFQETVTDETIIFDFKMRDGRATSRNAIKLLRLMGYTPEIVEAAEKQAEILAAKGAERYPGIDIQEQ